MAPRVPNLRATGDGKYHPLQRRRDGELWPAVATLQLSRQKFMTRKKGRAAVGKTAALFFPFDLFGSAGTSKGAELLADAFREMLADNQRERLATRADAYAGKVRVQELRLDTLVAYQKWRESARLAVRRAWQRQEFVLWVTGNHLGVLPLYEELGTRAADTLVVQFDAHLDIYNLSDCTRELSHGNFLLHATEPLPAIINLGTRELLLRHDHVRRYYRQAFPADRLTIDPEPALRTLAQACEAASGVFLDIDCDVFDPAFFPAVANPLPFGLDPPLFLRLLNAAWSKKVMGVAISEFDPGRDRNDQSLALLVWLLEYLLLRRYEGFGTYA